MFNDEIEILAFRLKYLEPVVDHFFVAESDSTFSGKPKPMNGAIAVALSGISSAKVTLIKYHFSQELLEFAVKDRWPLERFARQSLSAEFEQMGSDDFVLLSDVDEIPSRSQVELVRQASPMEIMRFKTPLYLGKANWQSPDGSRWMTVKFGPALLFKDLNEIRYRKCKEFKSSPGAHFSFLFKTYKEIESKTSNRAHLELDLNRNLNRELFSIAEKYRVIHTGQFYRKGFGILKERKQNELNEVQRAFLITNPEFFDFSTSKESFRDRFIASFSITESMKAQQHIPLIFSMSNFLRAIFWWLVRRFVAIFQRHLRRLAIGR